MDIQQAFFSSDGRINRLRYLKYSLLLGCIYVVVAVISFILFSDDYGNVSSAGEMFLMFVSLVRIVPSYFLDVKRLHDVNMDNELAKINAVVNVVCALAGDSYNMSVKDMIMVFASLCITLYLLFKAGDRGDNQYGSDPLENKS